MARYFQPVNAINAVNATSVPTFGTSLVEQESHLIVTHLEFDPKGQQLVAMVRTIINNDAKLCFTISKRLDDDH